MEYVFTECSLRTKGNSHMNLSGSQVVERTYDDNIITDVFDIVDKYLSKEDSDGNCYDWYHIKNHYRMIDKFTPGKKVLENGIKENEDATFDLGEIVDENSNSVLDLADYVSSLEERIEALEGGK